jgi:hypothetical protein
MLIISQNPLSRNARHVCECVCVERERERERRGPLYEVKPARMCECEHLILAGNGVYLDPESPRHVLVCVCAASMSKSAFIYFIFIASPDLFSGGWARRHSNNNSNNKCNNNNNDNNNLNDNNDHDIFRASPGLPSGGWARGHSTSSQLQSRAAANRGIVFV